MIIFILHQKDPEKSRAVGAGGEADEAGKANVRKSPHIPCRSVKLLEGLRRPFGIVIGENCILVSEESRLSVYTREGQQLMEVESLTVGDGQTNEIDPKGVVISERRDIYIADNMADRVLKLNAKLEVVKSVGGRGWELGRFHDPRGLALSKDDTKLFVCDWGNGRVQVLDTDLRVLGSIGSSGSGEGELGFPMDVSCDSAGSIYIAEFYRVQVFSQDGVFLRTIGHRGPCLGGVCVDHDWVYVTESGCVSVFTVSGQFMGSFGGQHLTSPQGITTCKDGLLYVCDYAEGSVIKMF